jgi:hypothetical protein
LEKALGGDLRASADFNFAVGNVKPAHVEITGIG